MNEQPAAPEGSSLSSSLYVGLRAQDSTAWARLVRLFTPLVLAWCRRAGLQQQDADDVSQEVFRAVTTGLERFRRGEGSFRGWLHGITRNQLLAWRRGQNRQPVGAGGSEARQLLDEVPDAPQDPSGDLQRPDDRHLVLREAVLLLRDEVEERTWRAFLATAVEGRPPADVAADLGLSVNSVYLAKARLLKRLREELGELLD